MWGLGPGVGLTAHAGAGEGDAVAVAPPGVGRQIRREGMQAMHTAITADDPLGARIIGQQPDPRFNQLQDEILKEIADLHYLS